MTSSCSPCRAAAFRWRTKSHARSRSRSKCSSFENWVYPDIRSWRWRNRLGNVRILNNDVVSWYRISQSVIHEVAREEQVELERRARTYRNGRTPVDVRNRIVLLVDDGLATGSSMRAAVQAVRAQAPARIVVAIPVGAADTCRDFAELADGIVCVRTPEVFAAVGEWYRDFPQTTDEEVRALLRAASEELSKTR